MYEVVESIAKNVCNELSKLLPNLNWQCGGNWIGGFNEGGIIKYRIAFSGDNITLEKIYDTLQYNSLPIAPMSSHFGYSLNEEEAIIGQHFSYSEDFVNNIVEFINIFKN